LIIIEINSQELFIHENAIRGFLISLALDHKIPYILSKDSNETARYLSILANRKDNKPFSMRQSIRFNSKEKQIQYILEGFPNIGPVKSKKLIDKFGSLKNIINANEEELKPILGIKTLDFKTLLE
jgi:Fanconi anemia group M protein